MVMGEFGRNGSGDEVMNRAAPFVCTDRLM